MLVSRKESFLDKEVLPITTPSFHSTNHAKALRTIK